VKVKREDVDCSATVQNGGRDYRAGVIACAPGAPLASAGTHRTRMHDSRSGEHM
jgi:hypothetical protein